MTDTSPTAFPASSGAEVYGMSLRDYFAGQALIGLLSRLALDEDNNQPVMEDYAEGAYTMADAMLAARSK